MQDRLLSPEAPWPGLESYPESGAPYFHGRADEVARLLSLVTNHSLVLLHGESGLGKTSLLQAGLFPRLRDHDLLPVLVRLDHAPASLPYGEQVRLAIGQTLGTNRVDGPAPVPGTRLWEWLHDPATVLWSERQAVLTPVLIFDQFEELFTIGGGLRNAKTREFVDEIAELVLDRPPERLRGALARFERDRPTVPVVLAFREEFLADVEELLPQFGPRLQVRLRLTALSTDQAIRAVVAAGAIGSEDRAPLVSPEVAELVVREVAGGRQYVEPSLLSMYCRELNTGRIADDCASITADLVRTAGTAVLPRFYERSVADLPEQMVEFLEERLLTERQRRNLVALDDALSVPGVTRALLDSLVDRRLVRIEERYGAERIELTHDVLTPIVAAARTTRRAEREERRLAAELEEARVASQTLSRDRQRWRRLSIAAFSGMVASAVALAVVFAQQARVRAAEAVAGAESRRASLIAGEALLRRAAADDARVSGLVGLARRLAAARQLPQSTAHRSAVLFAMSSLEQTLLVGHEYPVASIAFSVDGSRIATRDVAGSARIWDSRTGATVGKPLQWVTSLVFSKDGRQLAAASTEPSTAHGSTQLLDAFTGSGLGGHQRGPRGISELAYGQDGDLVAVATSPLSIRLWSASLSIPSLRRFGSVDSMQPPRRHGSADSMQPISPPLPKTSRMAVVQRIDGRWLAASSPEGRGIQLWDALSGVPLGRTLDSDYFSSVAFSPDGRYLVGSSGGEIRVWSTATGTPLTMRRVDVQGWVFSPGGNRLATWDDEGSIRQWNPATGKVLGAPFSSDRLVELESYSKPVVYSKDEAMLAIASEDSVVTIRRASDGLLIGSPLRQGDRVTALVFDAEGRRLATAARDGLVQLWDLVTPLDSGPSRSDVVHPNTPSRFLHLSSDGRYVAIVNDSSNEVLVTDVETGRSLGPPLLVGSRIRSGAIVSDGRTIAIGSGRFEQLWSTASGLPLEWLPKDDSIGRLLTVSPDAKQAVYSFGNAGVCLVDVATGLVIGKPIRHETIPRDIALSPDRSLLAVVDVYGSVRIWRGASGVPVTDALWHQRPINGPLSSDRILVSSFSPDGTRLATASTAGAVRFWSTSTGKPEEIRLQHTSEVFAMAFSEDGHRLAVGLGGGAVHIWEVLSGAPLGRPVRLERDVRGLAFAAAGRALTIALEDGSTHRVNVNPLKDVETAELLDLAEVVAGIRYVGLESTEPVRDRAARYHAWRARAATWADAPSGSFHEFAHWFFMDRTVRPPLAGTPLRAP